MLGFEHAPFHCSILLLVTPMTTFWGVWKRELREYKLEGTGPHFTSLKVEVTRSRGSP